MIISYVALAAVIGFLARAVPQWWSRGNVRAESRSEANGGFRYYFRSFLAGALFANSIPHFIHGISGEYFPAPFFHNLGRGVGTDIANVVWGLLNFGAAYYYLRNFQDVRSRTQFRVVACIGFVSMSVFLSAVFSRAKFR